MLFTRMVRYCADDASGRDTGTFLDALRNVYASKIHAVRHDLCIR